MDDFKSFFGKLNTREKGIIRQLNTPFKIQSFLDSIDYSTESIYRCPLRVLRNRIAHCFDGALFAAAMMRLTGEPSLILEMIPNEMDDDHLLALYKKNGHWGAVAKSNFTGIRFREPVFRTLRELVLSYFVQYYNIDREKTLRGYTAPLNLKSFDSTHWMIHDEPLDQIAQRLDRMKRTLLLTPEMVAALSPVDDRLYHAGLQGSDKKGLFTPKNH
jgi:hypothetical protein